jgi:molybdopterin-containing oxidoreductase family membrane subunit
MKATTKTTSPSMAVTGILAVVAVIGFAAWAYQLSQGMSVLGVGQAIVWGGYIAAFFLFLGVGCSLVVLAAAGDLGWIPGVTASRSALLLGALGCFVAGGLTILMDIGKPERAFNLVLSPNFTSLFVWDFFGLVVAVIAAAVYYWVGPKGKVLPFIAGIVALFILAVEGWILAVNAAKPLWHNPSLPVVFFFEGLLAAAAVILVVKGAEGAFGSFLVKAAKALLVVLLLTTVLEVVTESGGADAGQAAHEILTTGALAPLFWGQLLLGIVVPFALLQWMQSAKWAVMLAGVLAIVGVYVAKLDLLVAGQSLPFMQAQASYAPTVVEIVAVLGMAGLAGLVVALGQRFVPSKAAA